MSALVFLISHGALALFGVAAARSTSAARWTVLGRGGFAFVAGAVFLTIEATLFSIIGLRWSVLTLAAPLLALSAYSLSGRRAAGAEAKTLDREPVAPLLPILMVVLSLFHLAAGIATTRSTSIDYVFFWGVKAVRFAEARGIDAAFLVAPFSRHAHVNYPPLVPITNAWSALAAGEFPWRIAPLTSWIWLAASLPVLYSLLRVRLRRRDSALVTAFWSMAMSLSLAGSMNGGNAEVPLLVFETLACGLILVAPVRESVIPLSILFAGAVLTKQEGAVAVALLVLGALARDLIARERLRITPWLATLILPVAAVGLWWTFSTFNGVPLNDPIREKALTMSLDHSGVIFRAVLQNLHAGSWGLSWVIAIAMLVAFRAAWRELLPALALAIGLIAFSIFFFLHVRADHAMVIEWTLPRLSQPALSALIVAAGLAAFDGRYRITIPA